MNEIFGRLTSRMPTNKSTINNIFFHLRIMSDEMMNYEKPKKLKNDSMLNLSSKLFVHLNCLSELEY